MHGLSVMRRPMIRKYAICVLVENAGFGGVVSAPIAAMCIEQYLYEHLIRNNSLESIIAHTPETPDE